MDLGLEGRVVLVSGASRGIGRVIALSFGREHARVAITYNNDKQAATAVANEIVGVGGESLVLKLDLSDRASIDDAVAAVASNFGGLDVLICNAVRWPRGESLTSADAAAWGAAVETNLVGTAATVRAGLPYLSRSRSGRIVLISSTISRSGMVGRSAYATAKAGLDGLMAALKWEAGQDGILVNVVGPGFTLNERSLARFTGAFRESIISQTPSGKVSTPEDVAATVVFLGSPVNGNITGAYVPVDGGMN